MQPNPKTGVTRLRFLVTAEYIVDAVYSQSDGASAARLDGLIERTLYQIPLSQGIVSGDGRIRVDRGRVQIAKIRPDE